jgi:hypothetical protein
VTTLDGYPRTRMQEWMVSGAARTTAYVARSSVKSRRGRMTSSCGAPSRFRGGRLADGVALLYDEHSASTSFAGMLSHPTGARAAAFV